MVRCITCNVFQMRQFCRFFNCLAWYVVIEFNRKPCPNNTTYDDALFADRFRYLLTMFGIRMLIGLSRLIHAHVAYETDGAKIIAALCRISDCLHDLIRLNAIICHVERARCMMMWFSMMHSDINWLMFEVCILIGLYLLLDTHIAYKYLYKTSPHITGMFRETISHCEL